MKRKLLIEQGSDIMNYKLCVKGNNKEKIINVDELIRDKKNGYSLENIDRFTMMFQNEKEFKIYLLAKKSINISEYYEELLVVYGDKKVRYIPVLYSNEEEINNLLNLAREIKSYFNFEKNHTSFSTSSYESILNNYRYITNFFSVFEDISRSKKFLNVIAEYSSNNPNQRSNVGDINLYLSQDFGRKKCKYLYVALFELFRREFYKYDSDDKELVFNYKGFRDFCAFYCNYKSGNKQKNIPQDSNQLNESSAFNGYEGEQLKLKGFK